MVTTTDNLPNDVEALKALLKEKEQQIACYKSRAEALQEQLNLLLAKRFGPSSEKGDKLQLGLFNEAEAAVVDEEDEVAVSLTVPAHQRKKPGRKPLPDYIERVEVLHDLPEAEKVCPHDGTALERIGELVVPLINLLRDTVLEHGIVQMDETTVQVLKESDKSPSSKSYMWVQRGGPPGKSVILFDYDPSRSGAVPLRLLEGFTGCLQCDGYEGYGAVGKREDIVLVGCWAHARRRFDEAGKKGKAKAGRATKGLAIIQKLYRIEKLAKELTPEERKAMRQAQAVPLLNEMRDWLDTSLPEVPPQSAVGKALNYLHGQWPKLVRYVDDGRLDIDNNAAERTIRPFVIGRNNWLFSDTVNGAEASARLYSLTLTAKANGHEPYRYLRHVFKELPAATSLQDIEALLPFNIDAESLK
jgi:hypothetical protein